MKNKIITACLLLLASCISAQSQGPVSCYTFDNGTIQDDARPSNTPMRLGQLYWGADRFGRTQSAMSFNCNNMIGIGSDSVVKPLVGTVSLWAKADSLCMNGIAPQLYSPIITAPLVGGDSYYSLSHNFARLRTKAAAGYRLISSADNSGRLHLWHHLTITFSTDTVKFYQNGSLVGQSWIPNSTYHPTAQVAVGGDVYTGNTFYGLIDDIRIYDRVLTPSEVRSLYQLTAAAAVGCNLVLGNETVEGEAMLPTVYPNPSRGELYISHPKGLGFSDAKCFDVSGRLVLSASNLAPSAQLSLNTVSSGIYFLLLADEEGKVSRHKVIKQD